ncbi:HYR domain-containing protein [Flavobacteriales bacterium]|nr:HYR domain-containing protein [Flavobacteriales bacterium]
MKKILPLLTLFIAFNVGFSQTVIYDLGTADISTPDLVGSFNCPAATGALVYGFGGALGFAWTSTGSVGPSSISLEIYESWNDCPNSIPVSLNSSAEGTYGAIVNSCGTVTTIPLSSANYNFGAANFVELDRVVGGGLIELDENPAWGTGIFARVIVNYPLPPGPPVANPDMATVVGGTTGNFIDVQANDTDPNMDPLTTSIVVPPFSGGTATVINGDSISYDPPAGFCGSDTLTYQVCDPSMPIPLCDKDTVFITVTDGEGPTVVCQNINVYLDSSGTASIVAADVDGGTTDNCNTFNLAIDVSTFDCSDILPPSSNNLVITGAFDGPLPGGLPKGVELYAINAIADLSQYGISSANNGSGTTDSAEFEFPPVALTAGQFIYATSDSAGFADFFGFNADFIDNSMNVNGDDAIELFHMGSVIDVFGNVNVDGTGQPWDYLDGWAYSKNTRFLGSTFNNGEWRYSGTNAFDGETSNLFASVPFPIGSYTPSIGGTDVTLTATDALGNSSDCVAAVTVLDTIAPYFSNCPANIVVAANADSCTAIVTWSGPLEFDNCSSPVVTSSNNSGDSFSQGTTTVTYTVTDEGGNVATCTFDVTVTAPLTASSNTTDVLCNGDSTGTAALVITGNVGMATADWGAVMPSMLPAGTHFYVVTDSVGCSYTDSVVILEPSAIVLSASTTPASGGLSNGEIDLTVSGGTPGYVFDWDNDGTGDNDDSEDLTALTIGTYHVTVTDTAGCTDTLSVYVDGSFGIQETNKALEFKIYPNPSRGIFTVENKNAEISAIEVLNLIGDRIVSVRNPTAKIEIDLTNESAGVYLIKITAKNNMLTKKIILSK